MYMCILEYNIILTYIRYRTELGLFTVTLVNSFKKIDYFHVFAFLEKKKTTYYTCTMSLSVVTY